MIAQEYFSHGIELVGARRWCRSALKTDIDEAGQVHKERFNIITFADFQLRVSSCAAWKSP